MYVYIWWESKASEDYDKKQKELNEQVGTLLNLVPEIESQEYWERIIRKALKEHSFEAVKGDIKYVFSSKDVKNYIAYFEKSLKNGHYGKDSLLKEKAIEEKKKKDK